MIDISIGKRIIRKVQLYDIFIVQHRWLLARAINIYLLLFQGGISLGGIVWGKLASKLRVEYALYAAALWLILSVYLTIPFPLRNIDIGIFKLPEISSVVLPNLEISNTEDPGLVWIDYEILKENI